MVRPQATLKAVREGAGLPGLRFHDCRHHFISMCVMSGVDTLTIANWVGHSDGGVLIGRTYGHLDPKHKRASAAKVKFTQSGQCVPTEVLAPNPTLSGLDAFSVEELLAADQKKVNSTGK